MTVSFWQDRSSEAEHTTDFLVVGAGISGASAAYWLAQRGERVMVVDAADVASGASGRSGGMLLLGTADPYSRVVDLFGSERAAELWRFTDENRRALLERIIGDGAHDAALRVVRGGTASASVSEHEQSELERSAAMLERDGFPMQLYGRAAAVEALGTSAFHGALVDPAGLTIDPARLTERVLAQATAAGAQVFSHHPVFRIEDDDDGVLVLTSRARFRAQMVLLCTNAYSPLVHPHFEGRVYPTRGQMLATEPLPRRITPWGVYADFGYEYFWQLPTGELVAGGWRQHHVEAEKGYSDETTEGVQDGLWAFLTGVFPDLAGVRVTHRWAGVMGFSGDGLPFVGDLPGRPRIKYLAGHTGHGLGFAFLAAKALVDLALDGSPVGWLGAGRLTLKGK
jgi:glycine/D-amino acid oxidase-like deaminating enzyme